MPNDSNDSVLSSSTLLVQPSSSIEYAACMSSQEEPQSLALHKKVQPASLPNKYIPYLVSNVFVDANAVALVTDTQTLTYKELNQRSNQLAHYLQTFGVGPNVLVGCCLERSFDMVISLLGILKSGGTYVPLDPAYPIDRLQFMLQDAQVPILITNCALAPQFSAQGLQVISIDEHAPLLEAQSVLAPATSITADDLAYVIYTSGSTGLPKGVEITHGSLLNLISWHQHAFAVTASDRATQVTSPAFDATGWELWPYLTVGASVYLPNEETRYAPSHMRDWLLEQKITITFLPTVLAESIIGLEWPTTTALRFLLTGADTLQSYPSEQLPFALINNYGPTESTVVATSGRIEPTNSPVGLPSIGRPIANTQIVILDEHLQPVPAGEVGELCIGGAGLARGYLNRPALTAEKFIRHPLTQARLYRTGDLAYFLPDGQIAFIGRQDYQIKIHGFRIEPGEITYQLNAQPAVHSSVVIAREDTPGDKRLVAYLVLHSDAQTTPSELREALQAHLPDYMLPNLFVLIATLPLTAHGKLDRSALPQPDQDNLLQDNEDEEFSPLETQIASIVEQLMGLKYVSLDDNFFMLGGHSLLGTQIITHITEHFGVSLTLRTLFEAPTVRELASEVEERLLSALASMSEEEAQILLQQE